MDNAAYWEQRTTRTQQRLTERGIKAADAQMRKHYATAMESVVGSFVTTYEHLLARAADGNVTPADLYRLDRYWKMQAQLQHKLQALGEWQTYYLAKHFEQQYITIYENLGAVFPEAVSATAFSTVDKAAAAQIVNQIWCADGKSWSDRIWSNTEALREELNEKLTECVVAGRKPTFLRDALVERFNVSYYKANRVIQTEMAHIQTQAAQQRYIDAGITEMEFWADPDERTCDVCGKLHKKRYNIHDIAPIPAHPNCRCCLVPVVV